MTTFNRESGSPYSLGGVTSVIAAALAADSILFAMRAIASPASGTPRGPVQVNTVRLAWTTLTAFTTPITAGRRLGLYKGITALPTGVAIAAAPTGATEAGSVATYTTSTNHGLVAGDGVLIAGVGVAGYNGALLVASAPSGTTLTAALPVSGLGTAGGGTATKAAAANARNPTDTGADTGLEGGAAVFATTTGLTAGAFVRASLPVDVLDLTAFGAAGARVEEVYAFLDRPSGPLVLNPGELLVVSNPIAMDAGGTGQLSVSVEYTRRD